MRKTSILPLAAAVCTATFLADSARAQLTQPVTTLRAAPRASWTLLTVTGTPTQRRDNPGAASANRFYLFGGRDGNANTTTHNALYEFDGTAWTLKTPDTTATTSPVARGGACVAWNPVSNKLVVFGGDTGTGPVGGPVVTTALLNDTWEWDPVTNAWTDVTPLAGSPSPRRFASMTWDPTLGAMVMFGGDVALTPTTPVDETWAFIGGNWVQFTPVNVPPKRHNHTLVTRSAPYNDVLLCGGVDESFTTTTDRLRHLDVWTWNGSNWSKISDYDFVTQTGTYPATASAAQAVYDPLRQRVVLQGGQGISTGTFTSSAATATPTNTTFIYGYFNPTTSQWEQCNGSPSNWTSEFDCTTNQWTIYSRKLAAPALATWGENDPVIGRISRFYAAFVPSLGKIVKVGGQNSSGTGTITGTVVYQATPVASTAPVGAGCSGPGGLLTQTAVTQPWTTRVFQTQTTGFGPASLGYAIASVTPQSPGIPLNLLPLPGPGAGCELLVGSIDIEAFLVPTAGTAAFSVPLPDISVLPGLAGLTFYTQVAELDLSAGWVGTYTSNALTCVVGAM